MTIRKTLLATVAAASLALVAAPAMAQTAAPATPAAGTMAPGAAMPMGEAEMTHGTETGKVGSLSLATSRVAVEKASDPMVKMFAEFEVAEQETISDVLMSIKASPDAAEGALKKPTDAEVQAMIDAAGKTELEKLQGLSGAEFDKAYVTAQLDGHRKLLTIQEDYLKVGQNREHLDVAKLARGQIREHISILEELQKKVG